MKWGYCEDVESMSGDRDGIGCESGDMRPCVWGVLMTKCAKGEVAESRNAGVTGVFDCREQDTDVTPPASPVSHLSLPSPSLLTPMSKVRPWVVLILLYRTEGTVNSGGVLGRRTVI